MAGLNTVVRLDVDFNFVFQSANGILCWLLLGVATG